MTAVSNIRAARCFHSNRVPLARRRRASSESEKARMNMTYAVALRSNVSSRNATMAIEMSTLSEAYMGCVRRKMGAHVRMTEGEGDASS